MDHLGQRAGLAPGVADVRWEIPGVADVAVFLRALPSLVPDDSTLFVEGRPSERIRSFLASHAVEPRIEIEHGTLWPRQDIFHVRLDSDTVAELAALAGECAAPELADHIHVYVDDRVVLSWFDFPDDPIYLADRIPESNVAEFCQALGVHATRIPTL